MTTVLLVRHGRTGANAGGILAGWTPGVPLDEAGRAQVAALARRLAAVPLAAVVTSPLQRCQETADAVVTMAGPAAAARPEPVIEQGLGECRYGDWTGRLLKDLVRDPLWRVVQTYPSAVTFPGEAGESMLAMQHRAVAAIRDHDARIGARHGKDAVWVAVSHGDVIKAILADALGLHLDGFQRLVVDPCSVSVIRYTTLRPFALRINDVGGDLACLALPGDRRSLLANPRSCRHGRRTDSDAVIGGGDASPPVPPASAAATGGTVLRGRSRHRVAAMPRLLYDYNPPERFVAGTVGQPGSRTFFLQARTGGRLTSVVLEKQQMSVLAERVDELLDEVLRRSGGAAPVPALTPADAEDNEPLDTPIEEEFRVGAMSLAWDADAEQVVIECFAEGTPIEEDDEDDQGTTTVADTADDENEPDGAVLRVSISGTTARAFAKRALAVVAAGRPPCPFCSTPLDPEGHICPRANGYRR